MKFELCKPSFVDACTKTVQFDLVRDFLECTPDVTYVTKRVLVFSNMNMKCTHDLKNVLFELTFRSIKNFNFGKKQKSRKSMLIRFF